MELAFLHSYLYELEAFINKALILILYKHDLLSGNFILRILIINLVYIGYLHSEKKLILEES